MNSLSTIPSDLIRFTFFFKENLEGLNEPLADTLYHPHPGLPLVLHVADVEGHRPELLADLAVELPAGLHLEHVAVIRLLVDGDLGILLPTQTLASADQYVYGINLAKKFYNSISTHSPNIHLMHGEVKLFVFFPLRLRWILDDCLLTVYSVLLQLV